MMKGNILKMHTRLDKTAENLPVQYHLPIGDDCVPMNEHIDSFVRLRYQGEINCIACARKTSKSFGQGYCFPCFRSLARCDMCIMRPETCHYAAGTCREPDWGDNNCFIPHFVYLANSSALKVGITRHTQLPTRWMDQGASQALPIFEVANRLQSGLIESVLKQHISDRTDWRKMLRADAEPLDLKMLSEVLLASCVTDIDAVIKEQGESAIRRLDEEVVTISYPIAHYPEKIKSLSFDKQAEIAGTLLGIKGQYLILDSGVLNIRKFSGYNIELDFV